MLVSLHLGLYQCSFTDKLQKHKLEINWKFICTSCRSPSGRERRGADQTLPAGTAEHPAGVRQQVDEPQLQSAGLPPSAPAEGRTGGLQPGAAGASGQPGAAAGRLQEYAEIWS